LGRAGGRKDDIDRLSIDRVQFHAPALPHAGTKGAAGLKPEKASALLMALDQEPLAAATPAVITASALGLSLNLKSRLMSQA
jgi:hypothetical protein